MKKTLLIFSVLLAQQTPAFAESKTETYSLKNGLKFVPSYQQGLVEIKQTDSRVELVPAPAPEDDSGVPYAILCAAIELDNEKFQKLATVRVAAQTKIPSAMMNSRYGGVTTIGADEISVTADFPVPGSQDSYKIQATTDTVSTDPNNHSHQYMTVGFLKNGKAVGGDRIVKSTLPISKYRTTGFFAYLKTKEDHFEGSSVSVSPRIYVASHSKFADQEDVDTELEEGLGSTSLISELVLDEAGRPSTVPSEPRKISICWKPNNYTSVTMESAELIDPKIELRYAE